MAEVQIIPSLAKASSRERRQLRRQTARERLWYANYPRFSTNEAILQAAHEGRLAFVDLDENSLPIGRLRNPEYFATLTPYLLHPSRLALKAIGALWRAELATRGIHNSKLRLSVTSLTRSEARQTKLVRDPTKLASPRSTHCVGAAFDVDASAYYIMSGAGPIPVMHPDRAPAAVEHIGTTLMRGIQNTYKPPSSTAAYDPQITDSLVALTNALHRAGVINRIVEYGQQNSANRCVHVAPNPNVDFATFMPAA